MSTPQRAAELYQPPLQKAPANRESVASPRNLLEFTKHTFVVNALGVLWVARVLFSTKHDMAQVMHFGPDLPETLLLLQRFTGQLLVADVVKIASMDATHLQLWMKPSLAHIHAPDPFSKSPHAARHQFIVVSPIIVVWSHIPNEFTQVLAICRFHCTRQHWILFPG